MANWQLSVEVLLLAAAGGILASSFCVGWFLHWAGEVAWAKLKRRAKDDP